ncbi:MAG: bactofilin family protein [Myxococcota bacterium]
MSLAADARSERLGPAELAAAPVLEAGAVFRGLVTFRGGATVEGRVEGDVIARGTLHLGPSGEIEGRIEVDEAIVAGRVRGTVHARQRIEVRPGGRVEGDLQAPRVSLADGCRISGRCHSGPAAGPGSTADPANPEIPGDSPPAATIRCFSSP